MIAWKGLSVREGLVPLVALLMCAQCMTGQSTSTPAVPAADATVKLREYEVVSIKENKSSDENTSSMSTPDGFRAVNTNLGYMIAEAYGVRFDLVSGGPGWLTARRFDVEAKVVGPDVAAYDKLDDKDRLPLLKALLQERLGLQAHIEIKELPVYDLVVAKGGLKMAVAPPDPPKSDTPEDAKSGTPGRHNGNMRMTMGTMSGQGLPMQQIANQISYIVNRTVHNKTGLDGKYDIDLKWTSEANGQKQDNGSTDTAPSIFTAVQEQLGLKLQSTKGPVDTLVIDHVDLPTEN